jgi:WD40 repeat protein
MTARVVGVLPLIAAWFSCGQARAQQPELVLSPDLSRPTAIFGVQFYPEGSITVLGGNGSRVDRWTVGPSEDFSDFGSGYTEVRAAERIDATASADSYLVTASPLQMFVWDLKRRKRIREITTESLDGFPLTCHPSKLCAWEEGSPESRNIRMQNILDDATLRRLSLDSDVAMALAITADASLIAAAVNRPVVRLWSAADGRERKAFPLESGATSGEAPRAVGVPTKSMVLRDESSASVLRFSPDGKSLAAANDTAIHVFTVQDGGTASPARFWSCSRPGV